MYKNFNLTESEKEQILNRLKQNGYRKPINEQPYENEIDELKLVLNDPSDEKYFARHGEDPNGWTGSSNKVYHKDSPFNDDFDDETYDDFDTLHNAHPDFYKHYSGNNMGPEHAKKWFNTYKEKYGPLRIKRKKEMENPLNEGKQILINTFKKFIK